MVNATGSRRMFSVRSATLWLLLGAIVLIGLVAISAGLAKEASAGAVAKVTVNSTANTDDLVCNGAPNDTAIGNCTLREAINEVNDGLADEINFHPAVFPQSTHGVIQLELGLGPLPPIFQQVTINAKGVGVVLDGDFDDDGFGVPWGIMVLASNNGFDFELNGGGSTFIVQDVGCDLSQLVNEISGPGGCIAQAGSGEQSVEGNFSTGTGVGILVSGLCNFAERQAKASVSGGGFQSVCCPFLSASAVAGFPCNPCTAGSAVSGFLCEPCPLCKFGFPAGEGDVAGPVIVGGPFSLGDVIIDGIEVHNAMGSIGVLIEGTNLSNIQVTDSLIEADLDGVHINGDGTVAAPDMELTNNNVLVSGNSVIGDADNGGSGEAVEVGLQGDVAVGSKLLVQVNDNPNLTSLADDGVLMNYCDSPFDVGPGDCDAGGAAINFHANNNAVIHGGADGDDRGVEIDVQAEQNSDRIDVDAQVNGNGLIDTGGSDGVNVDVDVCCDTSFSISSVQVNENADIIGDDEAVEVIVDLGCGGNNQSTIEVNDNGSIESQNNDGVDLSAEVGEIAETDNIFSCDDDDGAGPAAQESDENSSLVQVNGNERIDGAFDGVDIGNETGSDTGNGDDNVSTNEVIGNGEIAGGGVEEGVDIDSDAGTQSSGTDADDNTTTVTVSENGNIEGEQAGVDIVAGSGIAEAADALPIAAPGGPADGDDNNTDVFVTDNGNITGNDDDGVDVSANSGGNNLSAEDNANSVTITGNGELIGRQDSGGAGVEVDMDVCCHSDDTVPDNTLTIAENGDIIGRNSDGIEVDLCCSFNVASIVNNGTIRGNGGDGIDLDLDDLFIGDPTVPGTCPEDCGIWSSLTILTVSGNEIFNSQNNGIDIFAGAMQNPLTQGPGAPPPALKSIITNNDIHDNRDSGIELANSFGMNITENQIYSNGDDPADDAGITIKTEDFGSFIPSTDLIPGNRNTISQNSIYDNVGLGIDLVGDPDKDGFGEAGIGCNQFPAIPSPNDCIPFPVIQTLSNNKLVGDACAGCHVELFVADDTPADQPPLGVQHGEGKTYLVTGTADALGDWSINLPCGLGDVQVTATATDKSKNTSEFSANFTVLGIPCTPTPPAPTNTEVVPTATPGGPTATPGGPTATPGGPTATPTGKACGDVNDNGTVNAIDATLILQLSAALVDSLVNEPSGDVNNNGQLNAVDAALILQRVANLIPVSGLTCPA